jgi:threonine aldolase
VSSVIDLRSDTATKPTREMYAAIAAAGLGDEQRREDPTVNELQRRAAELFGQEAALFVPTATMANQIALRLLGTRGGELLAEERTHVLVYESGGAAAHSGLVMRGVAAEAGWLTPAHVQEWAGLCDGVLQPPSVVVLEQTHRSAGGRVWPLDLFQRTVAAARELGVGVHLDGARLLNAAVASGVPAATWGGLADTVTVCFSKGLGCPLGAVLATSAERIEEAWRCKFQFGGALRQAGIVAAAMLYALDHNVDRLADDHRRARRLADGLAEAGLRVDPAATESNFVAIDVRPLGLGTSEAVTRIAEEGVLVSTLRPGVLRAVTYLGVDDEAIETAVDAIPLALGARVGA